MSEFDYKDAEEKTHDRVMLTLGIWGVFLAIVLSPLPVAMVIILGVSIVKTGDVQRASEWLLRNNACRAAFLRTTWDLVTYPLRMLKYYIRLAMYKHPIISSIIITLLIVGLGSLVAYKLIKLTHLLIAKYMLYYK